MPGQGPRSMMYKLHIALLNLSHMMGMVVPATTILTAVNEGAVN